MIKKNVLKSIALAGMVGSCLILSSCSSSPAKKQVVIPAKYAKLMKDMSDRGFQKAWGKPDEIRKYDKIDIAVNISPVQIEESWWARQNVRNIVSSKKSDMRYVAEFARNSFLAAFKDSKHLKLTDKPGPKTLALEFAIVQVIPNKPIMGAVSNLKNLTPIGLILSPVKLSMKSASDNTGGAIAMETIIRDSETGKILGVVAERSKGKTTYFNAKEFTAYANVRNIIRGWSKNIAIALDQIKEGKKVNVKSDSTWGVIDY